MRDPSGNFTLAPSNPVISGTIIATSWANGTLSDIAAALTDSLSRSGKGGMAAPLAMNGYKVTSIGYATAPTDVPQAIQIRDQQFNLFSSAGVDASGNNYIGVSLLGVPAAVGTMFILYASATNTGPMTLTVDGGAALPILINAAPTPPGLVVAGTFLNLIRVGDLTYRIMGLASSGGTVNSVQSTDASLISVVNDTGTNIATLTPHANVAGGMVKLDSGNKVPPTLLPFTDLHYVGIWNATPGTNPPTTGLGNGDFFVITVNGTLTLYRDSGANTYTAQTTAVVVGDAIILRVGSTNPGQPDGWYYDPAVAKPAVASTVSMTATSANAPFAGITNLQSWLNAADPAILARLPLTGGTMSGPIVQPLAPSTGTQLANRQYVDDKTAALVGVLSFNSRTGAVALASSDVTGALGYNPVNPASATFTGHVAGTTAHFANGVGGLYFAPTQYVANIGGTYAISLFNGQVQNLGLTADVVITDILNIFPGGIMRLTFNNTNFNITWPGNVYWPMGIAPNLAAGPNKVAVVMLFQPSAGTVLASATMY